MRTVTTTERRAGALAYGAGRHGRSSVNRWAIITQGERPDGTKLTGPMASPLYAQMMPQDLEAIVLYLRSLPSIPTP